MVVQGTIGGIVLPTLSAFRGPRKASRGLEVLSLGTVGQDLPQFSAICDESTVLRPAWLGVIAPDAILRLAPGGSTFQQPVRLSADFTSQVRLLGA